MAIVAVHAQDGAIQLLPDQIKWAALPPDVAPGAQLMTLVGPLDQPVHYTLRVPAGHVHYSWAKEGEVTYQESGIGPTSSAYVKK